MTDLQTPAPAIGMGDARVDAPPRAERMPGGGSGWFSRAFLHTVLIIVCLIWLLPTVSLFVSSLRPANEVLTTGWWNAFRLPFEFTLDNYKEVLTENNMAQSFLNSLLITIPATVIPILVAAYAAYAFAWMDFPGRNILFILVVGLLVIPVQSSLIPVLQFSTNLGITGSFPAV